MADQHPAADRAVTAMLPHARRLIDAVHSRDRAVVDGVLRVALAAPLPDGIDHGRVLVLCLADLALAPPATVDPTAVDRAVAGTLPGSQLNHPERTETVRHLRTRGWTVHRIAEHLDLDRAQVAGILGNLSRDQPMAGAPDDDSEEG